MRRIALAGCAILALGLFAAGCEDATEGMELFEAVLTGAGEVPARPVPGTGKAGFVFDGTNLTYSIEIDDMNLTPVTQAHIHTGAATVNGPVRVFLFGPNASFTTSDRTVMAQGTINASSQFFGITFDQLLNEMRAGNTYVNAHTVQFPGGEVRGQIRLVN